MSPSGEAKAVRAVDLWKRYRGGGGSEAVALRGASLEAVQGQGVAICGSSGSGKTTLLNLLAGLDCPDSGTIEIDGRELGSMGEKERTLLRRLRIGFVFQFFNLLPTLTARENVFLALELAGRGGRAEADEALWEVGLEGLEGRYPHELSGGEQQRVAIARALVKRPALVLADEPTGNLDTATGHRVMELLSGRCRENGTALVMATHSPRAARCADRLLQIVDGILREAPLEE